MPKVIRLAEQDLDDGRPMTKGDTIKITFTKHPDNGKTGKVTRVFDSGEQMDVKLKSGKTVQVAIDDMEVLKFGPNSKP